MKRGLKIFLIIVILFVIIFFSLYIFLSVKAKPILVNQLERFLNRKVKIDEVNLSFPLNLEIKNLDIEDLLKTESVFISPDIFRIFTGKFALSELRMIKPKFNFKRGNQSQEKIPLFGKTEPVPPKRKMRIFLKKVILDKGYINFSDTLIKPEGIIIVVKGLDLVVENLAIPISGEITQFSLRGIILWGENECRGRLEASGWIDLYRKDMQANLRIEGIDGIYISPYYSKYLSPEELGIEKVTLNFFSQIQSHRNDLIANCQLELTELIFKERPPTEKEMITPQEVTKILDIFKTFEGKIVLNFVTKTKMDSPKFSIEDIKMAVEEKISESYKPDIKSEDIIIIKLPAKILEGIMKGTADVLRAGISGATAIGLEIKKALEEAFKREKKE